VSGGQRQGGRKEGHGSLRSYTESGIVQEEAWKGKTDPSKNIKRMTVLGNSGWEGEDTFKKNHYDQSSLKKKLWNETKPLGEGQKGGKNGKAGKGTSRASSTGNFVSGRGDRLATSVV